MTPETDPVSAESGSDFVSRLWEASSGALVLCDSNRRIIAVNDAFTELFGFSEKECTERDLDILITPAPFIPESETLSDMVLDGNPVSITTLRKRTDGELIRVFLSSYAIAADDQHSLIQFVFRMVPGGNEKRLTDQLSNNKILENAFENSCEPSLITDYSGIVKTCNSAFSADFNVALDIISGRNVTEFFIPEVILPEADYINAMARADRPLRLQTMRKKSDGKEIQVSLVSVPAGKDLMSRMFRTTYSTAITRADLSERNSFKGYPNPGTGSGMIFQCRTDRNRTMEFILPGTAAFTGYSEEQILSGKVSYGSLLVDMDREMVLRHIQDSLKTGEPYSITYRVKNKAGRTLWIMEQGQARKTGNDSIDFCEGCIVDITETIEESDTAENARERIERLHNVAGELQKSRSAGEIYRVCAEAGSSVLNGACSCIFLQDRDQMKIVASSGRENFPCESGCSLDMAAIALNTSGPCYFRSRDLSEGFCPAGSSGVCFRLGSKAVFQIMSSSSSVFGIVDSRILELLIGYTEQALKRIALQHQLINQALHDPLTGIYNRNYFNRLIQLEEHRARRLDSAISFIMVDVDNFKNINDRYGHQAGDQVLQEVAKALENALRKTDTVLRYGGDEFLIILTRMTSDYTHIVENRISKAIEKLQGFAAIDGNNITVSMGHAYWTPDSETTIDEILKVADLVMFENKRNKSAKKQ